MKGTVSTHTLLGNKCSIYLPPNYAASVAKGARYPVAYLFGEANIQQIMSYVEEKMSWNSKGRCSPFILVGIDSQSWERDFTPWKAEGGGKSPFVGGADKYIATLKEKIIPFINQAYATMADAGSTAFAGYSLAGLFSIYAMYKSGMACKVACMSGSLWYKDWLSWLEIQTLPAVSYDSSYKLYMSLGQEEYKTSNELMATINPCTEKTFRIVQSHIDSVMAGGLGETAFFEYNDGGHFSDVAQRIAKGLVYLFS